MKTILTTEELAYIQTMPSYAEMSQVAIASLQRLKNDYPTVLRIEVCGPISSGGKGNIEANLAEFNDVITELDNLGYAVFDQLPYEHVLQVMKAKDAESIGMEQAKVKLLEEFYRPIFAAGCIDRFVFMPDWYSSHGARWENETGKEYGIIRLELRKIWRILIKWGFANIIHLTRKMK